jgi:hypothetical protein
LSSEEWLEMTPRQVHALLKRQVKSWQREELLVGILASTTANFSFCRPDEPILAEDFMVHKLPEAAEPDGLTGEQVMAAFSRFPKNKS